MDSLNVEQAVRDRYSAASQAAEPALCCPVDYDKKYLDVLPAELIERDYGCGDPSKYVRSGEVVLDLGSGGGKICYIASQIVGPEGAVIGVDMNDDMLQLARQYQSEIAAKIGWGNVRFYKGRIQDLALDLDRLESHLSTKPVGDANAWLATLQVADQLRRSEPMIADDSIDVVLSNCVLNLVDPQARQQLFREIHRVLRPGGRAVISDITCDETVPEQLKQDPKLWSGCISGAFPESEFLEEFERAGFYGIEIVSRQEEAWAVVEGIEFRSMTVRAMKSVTGPSMDLKQAVIYQGPWKSVTDDDGRVLQRGVRTAVCNQSFARYSQMPYSDHLIAISPASPVELSTARPFELPNGTIRESRETKAVGSSELTVMPASDCCSAGGCC